MSGTGKLPDTITYLEMTAKPLRLPRPAPAGKLALMRAERCTPAFYRYLYVQVGEPCLWFERRPWTDAQFETHFARQDIEIFVFYVGGVPAGYFELERAATGDTELCYFGLVPDFIGQGFGFHFLQSAVDSGWLGATRRLWVHTSTYDHPRALGLYQRAGFRVYERRDILFDDPRLAGLLPRDLRHPRLPKLSA